MVNAESFDRSKQAWTPFQCVYKAPVTKNQHGSEGHASWAEVLLSTRATVSSELPECSPFSVDICAVQRVTAIGKPPEGKICSFAGLKNVVVFASKGKPYPWPMLHIQ